MIELFGNNSANYLCMSLLTPWYQHIYEGKTLNTTCIEYFTTLKGNLKFDECILKTSLTCSKKASVKDFLDS